MLKRKCSQKFRICRIVAGLENVVIAEPVKTRGFDRIDEIRRVLIVDVELVIAGNKIDRGNSIDNIQRLDHLIAMPDLAFERRRKKVPAVQHAHIPALSSRLSNHSDYAPKAASVAVLHVGKPVRVVDDDKCEP